MYLKLPFSLAAVLAAVAVMATPGPIFPAHGIQQLRSPAMATMSPRANDISQRHLPLEERQAQKVLMGCPEWFGEPPHSCAVCGGEDPNAPGKCKDPNASYWICQCSNTGMNGLTTSLVTATASGQTATGTYELDTMTEYGSLKQSITVSTTATATTTGGTVLETVAVVVLAGGVAWFLADVSGGAAAVAALEAPESAKDHDDDKSCPNPENKCSDCSGKYQMCTTGTDSGCACEETTCPADDSPDQPKCSDDGCNVQDGKCTGGNYEGCTCTQADCPDLAQYVFYCSDCGGKDDQGKCKGDPTEDPPNLWQGCDCTDAPDWNVQTPALATSGADQRQAALKELPEISIAPSQPSSAPLPNPSCDTSKVSNIPFNVFNPGVVSKFCSAINGGDKGKALAQIVDSNGNVIPNKNEVSSKRNIEKRTPPPNPNAYTGYTFALQWTGGDGSCNSDCGTVYGAIANDICGHMGSEQNVMTSEGSLNTGCGNYSYTITPPPATDPAPASNSPVLKCNTASPYKEFSRDAANTAIGKVCNDLHKGKVVLSQNGNSLPPAGKPLDDDSQVSGKGIAADGATLVINPNWALTGCEDQNNPTDVDFGAMSVADCVKAFLVPVDGCGNFSNPNGDTFWKWGGQNQAQCAFWNVNAQ